MLALVHTPGILRRRQLRRGNSGLRIRLDGELLVEDELNAAGRARICGVVANFVKDLSESGLTGHPQGRKRSAAPSEKPAEAERRH
jgi:hypothetical protein